MEDELRAAFIPGPRAAAGPVTGPVGAPWKNKRVRKRAVSRILSAPGLLFARRRASFICAARTRDAFRFRGTEAGHFVRPLFGLAPDGVYRASSLARTSGGLLPHLFTLAGAPARRESDQVAHRRSVFCGTFRRDASRRHRPRVSRAGSRGNRGVTRHRALWCSDFPPPEPGSGSDAPLFPNPQRIYARTVRSSNAGPRPAGRFKIAS
ncbi:MAG: hypothetical protein KatS3mg132_055 [Limisphaera sp.]|nr:MAG: hypothetical protein KatS3mg132_055 [Limisphaera sp.]